MRVIHVFAIFGPSLQLLTGLALALVVWLGGMQVLGAAISLGTLYAFTAYLRMLFEPLNGLAQKYNILQAALAAAERIIELLETEPALRDPEPIARRRSGSGVPVRTQSGSERAPRPSPATRRAASNSARCDGLGGRGAVHDACPGLRGRLVRLRRRGLGAARPVLRV